MNIPLPCCSARCLKTLSNSNSESHSDVLQLKEVAKKFAFLSFTQKSKPFYQNQTRITDLKYVIHNYQNQNETYIKYTFPSVGSVIRLQSIPESKQITLHLSWKEEFSCKSYNFRSTCFIPNQFSFSHITILCFENKF